MKKLLLLLFILFYPFNMLISQDIEEVEYFIDTDPGVGSGTALTLIAGNTVNILDSINISSLTEGLHLICLRYKDEDGLWGLSECRSFYIDEDRVVINSPPIMSAEYYIDTDPGIGFGTPITVTQGDEVSILESIDVSLLNLGFHILSIRFMDTDGNWSFTEGRNFYINEDRVVIISPPISNAEFYIDIDPGVGLGIPIDITQGETVVVLDSILISALTNGIHKIGIRFQDTNGNWGLTEGRVFYIDEEHQVVPSPGVARAEYFFDTDPGQGNGVQIVLDPEKEDIKVIANIEMDNELSIGDHIVTLRFVDTQGRWGLNEGRAFRVCTIDGPLADFDVLVWGNTISIDDKSKTVEHYLWDFGDGDTETVSNPTHTYTQAGEHDITLIVENICGKDTLVKTITIEGVWDYTPKIAGNQGTLTLTAYGAGFNANSNVELSQDGTIIDPVDIIVVDETVLIAIFEFDGISTGLWDVSFDGLTDGQDYVFEEGLQINDGSNIELWHQLSGRIDVKTGSSQEYTIEVGNDGDMNAVGVPVWLIIPDNAEIDFDYEFLSVDSAAATLAGIDLIGVPDFINISTIFGRDYNGKVYAFFISVLPPGYSLKISYTLTFETVQEYEVYTKISEPIFESYQELENNYLISKNKEVPLEGTHNNWLTCVFESSVEVLGYNPSNGCSENLIEVFIKDWIEFNKTTILNNITVGTTPTISNYVPGNFLSALYGTLLGCDTDNEDAADAIKYIGSFDNGVSQNLDCLNSFGSNDNIQKLDITVSESYSQYEKTGYATNHSNNRNYINDLSSCVYTIFFENNENAIGPVREVIIYDTLDLETLDISSFQLSSFSFAGREILIPSGLTEYFVEIDLRPDRDIIVRINARLDIESGVVKWHFMSIDPTTMEISENASDGFLNPNLNPPNGEGNVSFRIALLDELENGTQIKNRVSITFDDNVPIETDEWINTIDNDKPESSVEELDDEQTTLSFEVAWEGSDATSGIEFYNVFYSVDDGDFNIWQYMTIETAATFKGEPDKSYGFYSIATDFAGNREDDKNEAEASTTINVPFQRIDLSQGWNMISSYRNPVDLSVASIFENIEDDLLLIRNNAGDMYFPSLSINSIVDWDITQGYKAYMMEQATLDVFGTKIVPDETPIELPQGWSMISYLRDSEMSVVDCFADFVDDVLLIKNIDGDIYFPGININTLGNLTPGLGYMIYMMDEATLTYPSNSSPRQALKCDEITPRATYIVPEIHRTGNNMSLIIETEDLRNNSEISIWTTNNVLVGSGKVHNGKAAITIWGDNDRTEIIDGALQLENLKAMVFEKESAMSDEIELSNIRSTITDQNTDYLTYKTDDIILATVLSLSKATSEDILLTCKPNPTTGETVIEYKIEKDGFVSLQLYSISGQLIQKISEAERASGLHTLNFDGTKLANGVYNLQMLVGNVSTNRLLVIRK